MEDAGQRSQVRKIAEKERVYEIAKKLRNNKHYFSFTEYSLTLALSGRLRTCYRFQFSMP